MRLLLVPAVTLAIALTACAGGSSSPRTRMPPPAAAATASNVPSATAPVPSSSAEAAARTPVAPGDQVEVTGVVGTITTDPPAIQITRLSGASVARIEILAATQIRVAGGGRIDLSGVHTSDRIIADGAVNDRGDALLAAEVTVQPVVPGAAPGG
jgi:hypothetical protein